jgi:hypothetical protein
MDPNKRYSASVLYENLEKIKKINNYNNNTTSLDFISFLRGLSLLNNEEFAAVNFFDNNKNSEENDKSLDFIVKKSVVSNITPSTNVDSHSSSQISNNISYSDNIKESFFDSIEFLLNDEISHKLLLLICFDPMKISCKNVVCDDLEKNISLLKTNKIICKYYRLNITKKENCLMMKKENIDELICNMESEKEGGMIYEMSLILLMKFVIGSLREEKNQMNCMMICGELININGLDRLRMIF